MTLSRADGVLGVRYRCVLPIRPTPTAPSPRCCIDSCIDRWAPLRQSTAGLPGLLGSSSEPGPPRLRSAAGEAVTAAPRLWLGQSLWLPALALALTVPLAPGLALVPALARLRLVSYGLVRLRFRLRPGTGLRLGCGPGFGSDSAYLCHLGTGGQPERRRHVVSSSAPPRRTDQWNAEPSQPPAPSL